jgi:hypothetical protein
VTNVGTRNPEPPLAEAVVPNMRLKLAGAIVLTEIVGLCPSGHGTSSTTCCAGGPVAGSLSAIR